MQNGQTEPETEYRVKSVHSIKFLFIILMELLISHLISHFVTASSKGKAFTKILLYAFYAFFYALNGESAINTDNLAGYIVRHIIC